MAPKTSVDQLYGEIWAGEGLDPAAPPARGTEWLFEAFAELGPQAGQLVVDVGARDAKHALRLVQEHGLRAIAVDPVAHHLALARQAVAEAGVDIEIVQAGIEDMPIDDGVADWIWCRDVLVHVDLARGFAECARILRPGGRMLAYVTCATDLLEPRETAWLFDAVAIIPESTQPDAIERHATNAGLSLVSKTELAGEWRERMLEDGTWDVAADLLALSRLNRREDELVARHGRDSVEAVRGGLLWGVYQLVGKLCPTIYVLRRRHEMLTES